MEPSQTTAWTHVSCIGTQILYHWVSGEAQNCVLIVHNQCIIKKTSLCLLDPLDFSSALYRAPSAPRDVPCNFSLCCVYLEPTTYSFRKWRKQQLMCFPLLQPGPSTVYSNKTAPALLRKLLRIRLPTIQARNCLVCVWACWLSGAGSSPFISWSASGSFSSPCYTRGTAQHPHGIFAGHRETLLAGQPRCFILYSLWALISQRYIGLLASGESVASSVNLWDLPSLTAPSPADINIPFGLRFL